MCEVSVQIEDLIIYHEAPPTGSCFHCWFCSNGAYNAIHLLTWSKLFEQTVTSHICTKIKQVFFSIYTLAVMSVPWIKYTACMKRPFWMMSIMQN